MGNRSRNIGVSSVCPRISVPEFPCPGISRISCESALAKVGFGRKVKIASDVQRTVLVEADTRRRFFRYSPVEVLICYVNFVNSAGKSNH